MVKAHLGSHLRSRMTAMARLMILVILASFRAPMLTAMREHEQMSLDENLARTVANTLRHYC